MGRVTFETKKQANKKKKFISVIYSRTILLDFVLNLSRFFPIPTSLTAFTCITADNGNSEVQPYTGQEMLWLLYRYVLDKGGMASALMLTKVGTSALTLTKVGTLALMLRSYLSC